MNEKLNAFFGPFHKWVFLICLAITIGLIVTSFFIPPAGVIDGSVLAGVGELFGFAALGEVGAAVEKGKTAKVTKGGVELSIGDNKKHREERDYEA